MRLARSEGRLTKWRELAAELTPRDLAELQAYYLVEPWGPERDDLRAAMNTLTLTGAWTELSEQAREEIVRHLTSYTGDAPAERPASPNAMAAAARAALPGV